MLKRDTVARVWFSGPVGKRPRGHFLAQAKLPGDDIDSPYGRWDLVVEPVVESDVEQAETLLAFVGFLAPDAPADALKPGVMLELFNGPKALASAVIYSVSRPALLDESSTMDRDFLARPEAA